MCNPNLAPAVGQADLTVVHVAGEDEVERPVGEEIDDPREVGEQDAQVGVGVDALPRPRLAAHVRAGIDPDQLDAATTEYRAALGLAPQVREARLGLAVVLSAQGRAADAMRALDSARAQYPRDRDVLFGLALLGRDAGDTAAARRYARMLLEAHPQDAQGRALLQSLDAHR